MFVFYIGFLIIGMTLPIGTARTDVRNIFLILPIGDTREHFSTAQVFRLNIAQAKMKTKKMVREVAWNSKGSQEEHGILCEMLSSLTESGTTYTPSTFFFNRQSSRFKQVVKNFLFQLLIASR
jgi:hypothetical protein